MNSNIRPIAFYLPQYHAIPENDKWWGRGFTEWANVVRSKPRYRGHYQPHLPTELGFYDLRVPETRIAQAALAREHGIHGFCYYHYWFSGKRLLERPFHEVLNSEFPDFPFCLCWANESWSRRWDGKDSDILIEQTYSEQDDLNHINSLIPAFHDERYIRINGRPVFLFYRASKLPNARHTATLWREVARRNGIKDLYLCQVESFSSEPGDPTAHGFDAAVEFAPATYRLPVPIIRRAIWFLKRLIKKPYDVSYDYRDLMRMSLACDPPPYLRFPCVTPGWDNSARRRFGATYFKNASPKLYEAWLRQVVSSFSPPTVDENLVFINAWNEWAEGNHLEPCEKWGRLYLEATHRALDNSSCES